jgi:4-amino-4-deoxy-L-arabinose transferase-like glycosyltransferase
MNLFKNKTILFLLLLIAVGAFFRLYDLNWGSPYYFHPDERNIASSVSGLRFPDSMNPKFFAYGSLPIYLIYFTGLYTNLFFGTYNSQIPFPEAIVISRFYTAFFSILLIPLLYVIGTKLRNTTTGMIAAAFGTFSVGLIQFAHFGTFEMRLTFGSLLLFYMCLCYFQSGKTKYALLIGIVFGILCAIKVSSVVLLPLIVLTLFLKSKHVHAYSLLRRMQLLIVVGLLSVIVYVITNPFVIMDFHSFLGSMRYESGVATGSLPVFYTGEFTRLIPVLYPFTYIYPFLLNPLLTIFFIPAFVYMLFRIGKTKNRFFLLLVTCYLLLFLSQTFLYVQWTRYYTPTIPFIILIISVFLTDLLHTKKHMRRQFVKLCIVILFLASVVYGTAFVITAYVETDTRLQALLWARERIDEKDIIVSEVYDLGITPFNGYYRSIELFDFYGLDGGVSDTYLTQTLNNASYIILPSQRIIKTRLLDPETYPNGNTFYRNLADGSLGFTKVYETPCSVWCNIVYLGNPVYSFEGTASVFDRPTVTIYKK